jgi:hypothetical protein
MNKNLSVFSFAQDSHDYRWSSSTRRWDVNVLCFQASAVKMMYHKIWMLKIVEIRDTVDVGKSMA